MYNATVILGWRANIDLKPVMGKDAAILLSYMHMPRYRLLTVLNALRYAEQQAPAFPVMLNDILSKMDGAASVRSACQKLLNKMVAECAYSAQETAHLLHGIPLVRSSVSFATLNLSSEGSLQEVVVLCRNAISQGFMELYLCAYVYYGLVLSTRGSLWTLHSAM